MTYPKYGIVLCPQIKYTGSVVVVWRSYTADAESQEQEDEIAATYFATRRLPGSMTMYSVSGGRAHVVLRYKDFGVDESGVPYLQDEAQRLFFRIKDGLFQPYHLFDKNMAASWFTSAIGLSNRIDSIISRHIRQPLPYETESTENTALSIGGFESHLDTLHAITSLTQKAGMDFPNVNLWQPKAKKKVSLNLPLEADRLISRAALRTVRINNAAHAIQERLVKLQPIIDGQAMPASVGDIGDRAVTVNGSIVVKTDTEWSLEGSLLDSYEDTVYAGHDYMPLMQYGVNPPIDDPRATNKHKHVQDNGAVWDYDEDSQDGWVRSSVTLVPGPSGRILSPDDFVDVRIATHKEMSHVVGNFDKYMEEELRAPDSGPPDTLEPARAWHKHRLSTTAARKRKDILAAVSEQGVSLPAHCIEQRDAETEIARLLAQGSLQLDQADRRRPMKRTQARFAQLIRDVKVLRTPDWFHKGTSLPGNKLVHPWQSFTATDTEAPLSLQLKVANPQSSDDLGPIGLTYHINGDLQTGGNGRFKVASKPSANGAVPVLYVNPQGVDKDPPHGSIYRLDIDARNICGPDRVTIDVEHPRSLIEDPEFKSVGTSDAKWQVSGAALAEAKELKRKDLGGTPGPRDEEVIGRILRLVDNDKAQERFVLGDKIPITRETRYDVSIRARQLRGDRINYFLVEFLDRTGAPINNASYSYDNDAYPEGWLGVGTYFYWGVMGKVLASDPETFTHTFGKDGVGEIPPAARSFRVGMTFGWKGTTETELWIEHCQVNELVWR